jgi:hypothetical protein
LYCGRRPSAGSPATVGRSTLVALCSCCSSTWVIKPHHGDFGSILLKSILDVFRQEQRTNALHLRVVYELSIIPVAGGNVGSLNGDCSGPSSATACATWSGNRHAFEATWSRPTTTIGDDVECGSCDAFDTAEFYCERDINNKSSIKEGQERQRLTEKLLLVGRGTPARLIT